MEWLTCGLHRLSSSRAMMPESDTGRLGVVGAVAEVSAGVLRGAA